MSIGVDLINLKDAMHSAWYHLRKDKLVGEEDTPNPITYLPTKYLNEILMEANRAWPHNGI